MRRVLKAVSGRPVMALPWPSSGKLDDQGLWLYLQSTEVAGE